MKERICIFAGTTEGRVLAAELRGTYAVTVCVATEYGRETLGETDGLDVRVGRMDDVEMEAFFRENDFSHVIDATHPYAAAVSGNIRSACEKTGIKYLRLIRQSGQFWLRGKAISCSPPAPRSWTPLPVSICPGSGPVCSPWSRR